MIIKMKIQMIPISNERVSPSSKLWSTTRLVEVAMLVFTSFDNVKPSLDSPIIKLEFLISLALVTPESSFFKSIFRLILYGC